MRPNDTHGFFIGTVSKIYRNQSKQIENIQNDYSTYVGHFEFDKTISV